MTAPYSPPTDDDPFVPLWITEGVEKADCGACH